MTDTQTLSNNVDDLGAGDVAVDQKWYEVVTQVRDRRVWTVGSIGGGVTMMIRDDEAEPREVSLGALLAGWVPAW